MLSDYLSHSFKFACYLVENIENYNQALSVRSTANELAEQFGHLLAENDGVYIIKDKNGHLDCCQ